MKTITIPYSKIERLHKKIERANLNTYGRSISFGSMKAPILCSHHGSNLVDVPSNWREIVIDTYKCTSRVIS